jgi:RecJ-like exonuclease
MKENKRGLSIQEEKRVEKLNANTNLQVLIDDVSRKGVLEEKAFKALERKLEPQQVMCNACKGEGYKRDGDSCALCQGSGIVTKDADMRAVELVLAPKFPKTQISLNKDIDDMPTEDLLKAIDSM